MSKKSKLVIAAILAVLVALIGLWMVLANNAKPTNISESISGELNIQLALDKNIYTIGEEIVFKSFIEDTTITRKSYEFNSTCTQGYIYIDDQATQLVQACGQALTDVNIGPYMTVKYEYPFALVGELMS